MYTQVLSVTDALNAENPDQPLTIHMGLNSGTVLLGSTRFEGVRGMRWTFTASGPVTNLAARLAGMAQARQILVGPETVRRVAKRYHVQQLGREHLKNLAEAIEVACILGPA